MPYSLVWIEVPTHNLDRAIPFYQSVLEVEPRVTDEGVRRYAVFDAAGEAGIGISVNQTANFDPSNKGVLVYLMAGDLAAALKRVETAGGKVVTPITSMGSIGNYALVEDLDGNQLALYGPPAA